MTTIDQRLDTEQRPSGFILETSRRLQLSDWWMLSVGVLLGVIGAVCWWIDGVPLAAAVVGPIVALLLLFHFPTVLYAYGFLQATDPMFIFDRFLTFGKVIGVLIIAFAILNIRKLTGTGRTEHCRQILIWASVLCAAGALSIIWSADPLRSLTAAAQLLVQLLMVVITVHAIVAMPAVPYRMLIWVAAGAAVASIYIILFGMDQRAYGRATLSEETNPNTAALGLTICFGALPLLWVMWRSVIIRVGAIIVAGLIITALFHTGSRAAVLAALVAMPCAILLARSGNIFKKVVLIIVMFAITYAAALAVLEFADLGEKAESRLASMLGVSHGEAGTIAALESSRLELWGLHLDNWLSTGGLGTGIAASAVVSYERRSVYLDVHSSLVGSLVEMGIIGFIALIGLVMVTMVKIRNVSRPGWRIGLMTLFVTSCLFMVTHTTYTTKWFWFPLAFIAALVELDGRHSSRIEEKSKRQEINRSIEFLPLESATV